MTLDLRATICDACALARVIVVKEPEDEDDLPETTVACDAFPDGIPDGIIFGGFDHRNRYPDDHGIRFVLDPGQRGALAYYEAEQSLPGQ
jgi:hypothetical protein